MATISNNLQFNGLATGIDTTKIIDGLTSINQQRIDLLNTKKATIVDQQTTFGGLQAKLLDLQSTLTTLSRSVAGAFEGRKTTISDENIATAAASSTAQLGTFSIRVDALASAEQRASQGFADSSTNIKQGTLQIQVGSGTATTITIDSTNNTLQGLATAINNAGGDVTASIVKDGSSSPFRLLLTSSKTGAANTIQITNNLTTGTDSDVDLTQTVQAAANATVRLGSGVGAIVASSATNQVSDLISGVTLNLKSADPTKTLTVSVTSDTDTAKTAIQNLVGSFNSVIDFIDQRNDFDTKTQKAGVLLGNRDVSELQTSLQNVLSGTVPGLSSKANNLAAIGVTFTEKGTLQIDDAKLSNALSGKLDGVTLNDVRRIFALTGTSTNPGVSFNLGSSKTKTTVGNPVEVNITQAAQRASITGTTVLAGPVTLTSSNNNFLIRLNGISSALISLAPGTYSPGDLAAAIQARINADARLVGNSVSVNLNVGRLQISSNAFGNASRVEFVSGTALGSSGTPGVLGFVGNESSVGVDVAGSFKVGATTELATGLGQTLSGKSGNATTDGLQLKVTLGTADIGAAIDASVTVTQGVGNRLNDVLNKFLDPTTGRLKNLDDRFSQNISDIDSTVKKQNESLDSKKAQLVLQFASVESAVSKLKNLGDQLTSLLGNNNSK